MDRIPDWLIRRMSLLPASQVAATQRDGDLTLQLGDAPPIVVEIVRASDWTAAHLFEFSKRGMEQRQRPRLLLLDRVRPTLRHELASTGVSWAERDTGVLHVNLAPYFVHDTAPTEAYAPDTVPAARKRGTRPTKLVGKSGCCAESLLLWAAMHHGRMIPLTTPALLAEMAHVSIPLATKVLHRLEKEEVVEGQRHGAITDAWRLRRPERLLELWTSEDVREPVITRAYVHARASRQLLELLHRTSSVTSTWAVGGLTAANLYAPTLTADPISTIWVASTTPIGKVVEALGGEIVSDGANVEFRQMRYDPWSVHRLDLQKKEGYDQEPLQSSEADNVRDMLARATAPPPNSSTLPPLALVSRYRAYVETMHMGGRAPEVAEALRRTLALEVMTM